MASRVASAQSSAIIASPAAASETIVCTTGPINLWTDSALVILHWFIEFTVGTSGNLNTIKLRRGAALTSTLINVGGAVPVNAGNLVRYSGVYTDTPGGVAEQQYTLTLTVGSAAAISTVSDVYLLALVL